MSTFADDQIYGHATLPLFGADDAGETGDLAEALEERGRWRARDVMYIAGKWDQLARLIPRFSLEPFKANGDVPANPYLKAVVRQPLRQTENPMPVGVVSNTYRLAQHPDVIERCFAGLRSHGIKPETLRCELGLSELGEWMNFRVFFPEAYDHIPADRNPIRLRLECFNSVDGSSRLSLHLGWFRLVCSNGMIVGDTKASLRDTHDENLDLGAIANIISTGIAKVKADKMQLERWQRTEVDHFKLETWIDGYLAQKWGKKAACRVLHICRCGSDVDFLDPFDGAKPSEKTVKVVGEVPGSTIPARTLYDVVQAMSWIATRRTNVEERVEWQSQVPTHIEALRGRRRSPSLR